MKQRIRPRKNTPHNVKIIDAESNKVLGRVVDITADGLMMVGGEHVDPGRVFNLRIVLPSMTDGKHDITVQAEAVWSKPDTNPSFFQTGFQFQNLPGNDGFLLEDVMHRMNLVG